MNISSSSLPPAAADCTIQGATPTENRALDGSTLSALHTDEVFFPLFEYCSILPRHPLDLACLMPGLGYLIFKVVQAVNKTQLQTVHGEEEFFQMDT